MLPHNPERRRRVADASAGWLFHRTCDKRNGPRPLNGSNARNGKRSDSRGASIVFVCKHAAMNEQSSSRFISCNCSDNHCIGLTRDGRAFTWALTSQGNRFGQLCSSLPTSLHPANINEHREVSIGQRVIAVGAGGDKEAGHTALVGEDGSLFMCGCDRWQQLGLSTQKADIGGNAAGYTWDGGKIWQSSPKRVAALSNVKIIKVGCSLLLARL